MRAGLRVLLEGASHVSVVGEAATAKEALDVARHNRPQVMLLDADLPAGDCVELIRRIRAETGAAVMLLTASEGDERIFGALRAGAAGLVLKDAEPAELVRAIGALARGDVAVSPELMRRVVAELVSRPQPGRPTAGLLDELTAREREVMALVGLGQARLTSFAIATGCRKPRLVPRWSYVEESPLGRRQTRGRAASCQIGPPGKERA